MIKWKKDNELGEGEDKINVGWKVGKRETNGLINEMKRQNNLIFKGRRKWMKLKWMIKKNEWKNELTLKVKNVRKKVNESWI